MFYWLQLHTSTLEQTMKYFWKDVMFCRLVKNVHTGTNNTMIMKSYFWKDQSHSVGYSYTCLIWNKQWNRISEKTSRILLATVMHVRSGINNEIMFLKRPVTFCRPQLCMSTLEQSILFFIRPDMFCRLVTHVHSGTHNTIMPQQNKQQQQEKWLMSFCIALYALSVLRYVLCTQAIQFILDSTQVLVIVRDISYLF